MTKLTTCCFIVFISGIMADNKYFCDKCNNNRIFSSYYYDECNTRSKQPYKVVR